MQVGELDDNLKRCTFEDCQQVDYLASLCSHCGGTFCANHTAALEHHCPAFAASNRPGRVESRSTPLTSGQAFKPCGVRGCGEANHVTLRCPHCAGGFCVGHRLPESHNCPNAVLARGPSGTSSSRPERQHPKRRSSGAEEMCSVFAAKGVLYAPRNTRHTALGKMTSDPTDTVTPLVVMGREMGVRPFYMHFSRHVVVARARDSMLSQAALENAEVAAGRGVWDVYHIKPAAYKEEVARLQPLGESHTTKTLSDIGVEDGSILLVGKRGTITVKDVSEIHSYMKKMDKKKKQKSGEGPCTVT